MLCHILTMPTSGGTRYSRCGGGLLRGNEKAERFGRDAKTAAHILNLRTRMAEAEAVLKGLVLGGGRVRKDAHETGIASGAIDLEPCVQKRMCQAAWLKLALPAHTDRTRCCGIILIVFPRLL